MALYCWWCVATPGRRERTSSEAKGREGEGREGGRAKCNTDWIDTHWIVRYSGQLQRGPNRAGLGTLMRRYTSYTPSTRLAQLWRGTHLGQPLTTSKPKLRPQFAGSQPIRVRWKPTHAIWSVGYTKTELLDCIQTILRRRKVQRQRRWLKRRHNLNKAKNLWWKEKTRRLTN